MSQNTRFCAIFWLKIRVCAFFYAFSISEYYRTDTYFFTFLQNISKLYPTDIAWLLLDIFKYYPTFWNRTSAGQTDPNLRCLSINTLLEAQHPVALCKWYKPVTLHLFCHFLWYFIANTYTRYSFNHSYLVVFFCSSLPLWSNSWGSRNLVMSVLFECQFNSTNTIFPLTYCHFSWRSTSNLNEKGEFCIVLIFLFETISKF